MPVWAGKRLMKHLKMWSGEREKLCPITVDLQKQAPVQDYEPAWEKHTHVLTSHLWNLRLGTNGRRRLRQSWAGPSTEREPQQRVHPLSKGWEPDASTVFKGSSVQSSADQLTRTLAGQRRQWLHIRENTDFRELAQIISKQRTPTKIAGNNNTINSREEGEYDFQSCQIILLKMPIFQQKVTRFAKKQESMAIHKKKKKAVNRNCPWGTQMLDLLDKDFKIVHTSSKN